MRAAGHPGRGERAKVAARVRELVGEHPPRTARTPPEAGSAGGGQNWLPDDAFDVQVTGRVDAVAGPSRHIAGRSADNALHAGRSAVHRAAGAARLRWDPGRRGAAALGVVVVLLLAVAGWWVASSRPTEVPVGTTSPVAVSASGSWLSSTTASGSEPATGPSAGTAAAPANGTSTVAAQVVVDVAGRVRRPGVYRLPTGARVFDALRAAGGVRTGVSTVTLNLAATVQDGEQILVGVGGRSSITGGGPSGSAAMSADSSGASGTPVDLNTATLEQLETLPGIGPALGQRILDWRAAHGTFTGVDQLNDVSGIGDVRMTQVRPLVTV